jgi:hypothetical protein
MRKIPIGAGVRFEGRLGRRIRNPPRPKMPRGYVAVSFFKSDVVFLPSDKLEYVARNYDTALAWESAR